MEFHIFEDIMKQIDTLLLSNINVISDSLVDEFNGKFLPSATALYLTGMGIVMMFGMVSSDLGVHLIWTVGRVALISVIAMNVGGLGTNLADDIFKAPDELATLIVSGTPSEGGDITYVDSLLGQVWDIYEKMKQVAYANANALGIPELSTFIAAIMLLGCGMLMVIAGGSLLLLSKILLGVLIAIAPIFVMSLLWNSTRRFFESWLNHVCGAIIMAVISAVILKIILGIMTAYINVLPESFEDTTAQISTLPIIAIAIFSLIVFWQVPGLASGLGGGVATSTMGLGNYAMGRAISGNRSTYNAVRGNTLADIRSSARHRQLTSNWAAQNPGVIRQQYRNLHAKITGSSKNKSVAR